MDLLRGVFLVRDEHRRDVDLPSEKATPEKDLKPENGSSQGQKMAQAKAFYQKKMGPVKAIMQPWLSYLCRIRSTADLPEEVAM